MADVLLTGADGVVGSALVRTLLARGDAVTLLRRPGSRRRSALTLEGLDAHCRVAAGDLRDADAVDAALTGHRCDTVVHLAAQSLVGPALRDPVATFEVNVAGTWRLLEACRLHDVARVVVASSDKAYGPAGAQASTEADALAPRYPYDVSKACVDLIARSYFHAYALPVAVARLPNAYGGGDPHTSRLVPELVTAILAGRAPVIRSDGSPRRDFLHADDAAAAYVALVELLGTGAGGGEAYNAGAGRSYRVREVVDELLALSGTGLRAQYTGTGSPEGELVAAHVDAGKLRAATGWVPRVSLHDGLARTLAWYREHPGFLAT